MTDYLHDRESSEDTQRHLSENHDKLETDCVFLYKCMVRGERLTRQSVVEKYKINDRRLGDLYISGKCKKEWVKDVKGKRLYVEYFIPPPEAPTKEKSYIYWKGYFNNTLTQPKLF